MVEGGTSWASFSCRYGTKFDDACSPWEVWSMVWSCHESSAFFVLKHAGRTHEARNVAFSSEQSMSLLVHCN